jgi:hypothetical protein
VGSHAAAGAQTLALRHSVDGHERLFSWDTPELMRAPVREPDPRTSNEIAHGGRGKHFTCSLSGSDPRGDMHGKNEKIMRFGVSRHLPVGDGSLGNSV